MAPTTKSSDFDARFLDCLVGTKVSTFDDIDHQGLSAVLSAPGSPLPRFCSTWVITRKLSERAAYLTWELVEKDTGTPKTVV